MTREEKQKAIDALKISAPVMAVTQEEFNDYIQTLNKIMDWLEQEPILDKLKVEINKNIEQEDFARSVFINEEKDYRKANQCTGNLQAYEKVLDMLDDLLKENKDG